MKKIYHIFIEALSRVVVYIIVMKSISQICIMGHGLIIDLETPMDKSTSLLIFWPKISLCLVKGLTLTLTIPIVKHNSVILIQRLPL